MLTLFHWKRGGFRVEITGMFPFILGIQLKVLMCKEGGTSTEFLSCPGGEGGGIFVTTLLGDTPLIVAGGGGRWGASDNFRPDNNEWDSMLQNTGKIDFNLVAGGGSGTGGVMYTGLAIADAPLGFINGGTGRKSPSSNGGFGQGSFALGLGEGMVVTLVGEY